MEVGMLTINEAVNSGKLFNLAVPITELEIAEDVQAILHEKKVFYAWQLAQKTRRWLRDTAWLSETQIDSVGQALATQGLRFRTGLTPLLVDLLTLGKFKLALWEEEAIVVDLVVYANTGVSDETRRLILEQRDTAKPKIEAERLRLAGALSFPIGEDNAGLTDYYSRGIIAD